MKKIGLIDYGMGNIHSVRRSIENLGEDVLLISQKVQLGQCKAIIIPGQGAFDPAISNLTKTGLIEDIKDWITQGNSFLGICLGLQLLFDESDEGSQKGLGIIEGNVKKIPNILNQRIPHIGWCNLIPTKKSNLIYPDLSNSNWVYFDHSYYANPHDKTLISAEIEYGSIKLAAIIEHENLVACQFHPEKSGKSGESILRNWIKSIRLT